MDSRGGYVSKILYVKTKELGPLGGRAQLDPPMQLFFIFFFLKNFVEPRCFCGTTGCPYFRHCVTFSMGFQARVVLLPAFLLVCTFTW